MAMHWLADRLSRLRWMAVPIVAYLAITLVLPLANGAAVRGNFAHHAGWVIAGCAAIVGVALIGLVAELARSTARRLHRHLRGPS
jgi:hypothetical protein